MKRILLSFLATAVLAAPCAAAESDAAPVDRGDDEQPVVEVAFVLDTTGSMGGLIAGAKAKIWYIANQIVLGRPKPRVRMALVPYRDKGDAYVTKVYDLTDNIDKVYRDLMSFEAAGGGDGPENVNQALHDAVTKLDWSEDDTTLKIIYLVGDYPPHNEYEDAPTYDKIAYQAINEKGIYINTILCGSNAAAAKVWKDIALRSEGSFAQIDASGGVETVATPYDEELAELNSELTATNVYYGKAGARRKAERADAELATGMKAPAAADRAEFVAGAGGGKASAAGETAAPSGAKDLVDAVREGDVELSEVDVEDLPEKMQEMTPEQREAYLARQQERRDAVLSRIRDLSAKRAEHQRKAMTEAEDGAEGFDAKVVEQLLAQAAKKGLTYDAPAADEPDTADPESPEAPAE
ncbi:MAG: vWA domain-containing protein [Planctomycetota bacterium]